MTSHDRPSRFWEKLAAEHQRDLQSHGIEHFKRHQALRYFTWRWRFSRLWKSEQLRFLLSHTRPHEWLRCATASMDLSDRAWDGCSWSRRDRWLYVFATRLLWSYAETEDRRQVLKLDEPMLGDPFPVRWKGRLISQDLANVALEVGSISAGLAGSSPREILEVGAGYGRTAYALLSIYPDAAYTIVDIPPAIEISRRYLTTLFPQRRLRFLSPSESQGLDPGTIDLALSISSLQEMTPQQVREYLALFDRVAAGGTVFLKQWQRWHNPQDDVILSFDEYPIPGRWRLILKRPAAVQTRFVEAAWSVPR